MKPLAICAAIALAIIATVAIVPSSSWVFKNDADILLEHRQLGNGYVPDNEFELVVPQWAYEPQTYSGSAASEQFTRALLQQGGQNKVDAMARYTSSFPDDPVGWAALIRCVCRQGGRMPDEPVESDPLTEGADEAFKTGREAAIKGASLEPNNAFFTLMEATFDCQLGLLSKVPDALTRAAAKTSYDSHIFDQAQQMDRALDLEKGYRGQLVKASLWAGVDLPEFSHIRSFGKYLNRTGSLKEKRDMIQVADLISRKSDTLIEIYIALAWIHSAIGPPIQKDYLRSEHGPGDWSALSTKFDSHLASAHISPPTDGTARIQKKISDLTERGKDYVNTVDSGMARINVQAYGRPIMALAALVCIILFGLGAWFFTRIHSATFIKTVPHLVCIPAWIAFAIVTQTSEGIFVAGLFFGIVQFVLALTYLPDFPARLLTATTVVVFSFLLASPLVLDSLFIFAYCICIAVAILTWFLNRELRSRWALIAGLALSAISLAALVYAFEAQDPYYASISFPGVAFLIALATRIKLRVKVANNVALVLGIIGFLLACGFAGAFFGEALFFHGAPGAGLVAILLIAILGAMVFTGRSLVFLKWACCTSLVVFSLAYLFAVGGELRADAQIHLPTTKASREAEVVRNMARF
ncbi:MAG TPA: hypothetical protein VGL56_01265 [Fimbriimonadaceae bacterium]